ncbi:MAG TPA: class I SAM-dependent methyltransferase, partial [Burkholderiaceae bacterium]|nr:class I SAM-dependent methyltransferase [Burkholderiaceae bacterium]
MALIDGLLERKLDALAVPLALVLPDGHRIGPAEAAVVLQLKELGPLAHIAAGEVGRVAEDYVEGRLDFSGSMRDLMTVAAQMVGDDPTQDRASPSALQWWREIRQNLRSRAQHQPAVDARHIQFHYDVSDEFYGLWLDPRRIYSCGYFRDAGMNVAQAQEAKIDHVCRKLMLKPGERFLDVGA